MPALLGSGGTSMNASICEGSVREPNIVGAEGDTAVGTTATAAGSCVGVGLSVGTGISDGDSGSPLAETFGSAKRAA